MSRRPLPPYVIGKTFDRIFIRVGWVVIAFVWWGLFVFLAWVVTVR